MGDGHQTSLITLMNTGSTSPKCQCGAEATRLCDYVLGREHETHTAVENTETCDLPLCNDCAHLFGFMTMSDESGQRHCDTVDFCPFHHRMDQKKRLPKYADNLRHDPID